MRSPQTNKRLILTLLGIFQVLFLSACSSSLRTDNGLIGRLKNRGLVPLSPDNPYLAANLLVSREMEKSQDLKGFIEHRGAPAALEVEKGTFSNLSLKFYYPERDEYYTLEDLDNSWIINGPYPVPTADLGKLAPFTRKSAVNPRLTRSAALPASTESAQAVALPTPASPADANQTATAARGFQSPPLPHFESRSSETPSPSPGQAEGFGEIAAIRRIIAAAPDNSAEVSPRGDLVHYVTYPGETLSILSRWYTEDRENTSRLARMNTLKNPNKLGLGDQIVVPAYLLKNRKRLTREALEGLKVLSVEGR